MTASPSDGSQGAALRHARRARVRRIRRRVVASALALFVATWLLITVTLASGHDPALARSAVKASATSTPTTGTSTQATGTSTQNTATSPQSSGTSSLTSSQS